MGTSISNWVSSNRRLAIFTVIGLSYITILSLYRLVMDGIQDNLLLVIQLALVLLMLLYVLYGFVE